MRSGIAEKTFNYKPINKTVTRTPAAKRSSGDQFTSFAVPKEPREKTTRKKRYRPRRYPASSCKIGACECGEP